MRTPHINKRINGCNIVIVGGVEVQDGVAETLRQYVRLFLVTGKQIGIADVSVNKDVLFVEGVNNCFLNAVLDEVLTFAFFAVVKSDVNLLLGRHIDIGDIIAQRIFIMRRQGNAVAKALRKINLARRRLHIFEVIAVQDLTTDVAPIAIFAAHSVIRISQAEIAAKLFAGLQVLGLHPLKPAGGNIGIVVGNRHNIRQAVALVARGGQHPKNQYEYNSFHTILFLCLSVYSVVKIKTPIRRGLLLWCWTNM